MKLLSIIISFLLLAFISISSEDNKLYDNVEGIFQELLNVTDPFEDYNWPPTLEITEDTSIYAATYARYDEVNDNFGFIIKLSSGILEKICNGNKDLLAFILSHELAHIKLGHLTENLNHKSSLISRALSISEESEADIEGLKLTVDAGFSYKHIVKGLKHLAFNGYNTTAFECLSKEHPPWSERLTHIDSKQKDIWRMLTTFKNGSSFLSLYQYEPAIYCFEYVIDQFPACYEAHANIGYARLMRYIQLLEPDDIRDFNIGYIVTGTFYQESKSIQSLFRGIDIELWWDAVSSLKLSLTFKEDQALVKANLGLSYLVSPIKNIDLGKSAEYFSEALMLLQTDACLNEQQKASILINAGASYLKTNKSDTLILPLIIQADASYKQFAEFVGSHEDHLSNEVSNAIKYNRSLLFIKKGDSISQARSLLEDFLNSSYPDSPWWTSAYESYQNLSDQLHNRPKSADELKKLINGYHNPIVGIKIDRNEFILLSDQKNKILNQLENYSFQEKTVIPGKNLKRILFDELGFELLATDYIFAIFLNKKTSPEIVLYNPDFLQRTKSLYIGMDLYEFEALVGQTRFIENVALKSSKDNYRYYIDLGLAVMINHKTNKIQELVIAQIND